MKTMQAFRDQLAQDVTLQAEVRALLASGNGLAGVAAFAAARGIEVASFADAEMTDLELEIVAGGGGKGGGGGFFAASAVS